LADISLQADNEDAEKGTDSDEPEGDGPEGDEPEGDGSQQGDSDLEGDNDGEHSGEESTGEGNERPRSPEHSLDGAANDNPFAAVDEATLDQLFTGGSMQTKQPRPEKTTDTQPTPNVLDEIANSQPTPNPSLGQGSSIQGAQQNLLGKRRRLSPDASPKRALSSAPSDSSSPSARKSRKDKIENPARGSRASVRVRNKTNA
jgi:hypothetical protein